MGQAIADDVDCFCHACAFVCLCHAFAFVCLRHAFAFV